MDLEFFHEMRKRLKAMWRDHDRHNDSDVAVLLLEQMLFETQDRLAAILNQLSTEYTLARNEQKTEEVKRYAAKALPDDPVCQIGLVEFLIWRDRPEEAAQYIQQAIDVAKKSGHFVRDAVNSKARIAVRLGDVKMFEEALEFLVAYKPSADSNDIAYEHDFLRDIDRSKFNAALIDKYIEVSGGLPKDS